MYYKNQLLYRLCATKTGKKDLIPLWAMCLRELREP